MCAAALLDDAVDRGEPEPGPLALLLGGEEGLEDPRLASASSMPLPVSVTASRTYGPGVTADVLGRVLLVELDVGGLDGQLAAARAWRRGR